MPSSGTVLAFDFGERRIGVAVGELETRSAHPLERIETASPGAREQGLAKLVATWRPARFVVGIPQGRSASATALRRRAERFARSIETRFGVPVNRVDESFTSVEAESRLRAVAGGRRAAAASRKREIDALAAQLILEQFFAEGTR